MAECKACRAGTAAAGDCGAPAPAPVRVAVRKKGGVGDGRRDELLGRALLGDGARAGNDGKCAAADEEERDAANDNARNGAAAEARRDRRCWRGRRHHRRLHLNRRISDARDRERKCRNGDARRARDGVEAARERGERGGIELRERVRRRRCAHFVDESGRLKVARLGERQPRRRACDARIDGESGDEALRAVARRKGRGARRRSGAGRLQVARGACLRLKRSETPPLPCGASTRRRVGGDARARRETRDGDGRVDVPLHGREAG